MKNSCHSSHSSNTQQSYGTGGYHIGQHTQNISTTVENSLSTLLGHAVPYVSVYPTYVRFILTVLHKCLGN